MPLDILLAFAGYLLFSFLFTAMLVRFARKSDIARMARKRFYLFPIVPFMIVAQIAATLVKWLFVALIGIPFRMIRRAFELLSGHKPRRRKRTYYRY